MPRSADGGHGEASLSGVRGGWRRALILCAASMAICAVSVAAYADASSGRPQPPARAQAAKDAPARGAEWVVMAGSTFKDTLTGWTASIGWSLVWDLPGDYAIRASAAFPGSFEDAVILLSDAIYDHNPDFQVTIYRGNRVVHVRESSPSSTN